MVQKEVESIYCIGWLFVKMGYLKTSLHPGMSSLNQNEAAGYRKQHVNRIGMTACYLYTRFSIQFII
jgi:hypothetical protein